MEIYEGPFERSELVYPSVRITILHLREALMCEQVFTKVAEDLIVCDSVAKEFSSRKLAFLARQLGNRLEEEWQPETFRGIKQWSRLVVDDLKSQHPTLIDEETDKKLVSIITESVFVGLAAGILARGHGYKDPELKARAFKVLEEYLGYGELNDLRREATSAERKERRLIESEASLRKIDTFFDGLNIFALFSVFAFIIVFVGARLDIQVAGVDLALLVLVVFGAGLLLLRTYGEYRWQCTYLTMRGFLDDDSIWADRRRDDIQKVREGSL